MALPASVVTTPEFGWYVDVVINRIRLLFWSTTTILPSRSTATPNGALKRAAAPVPSAKPPPLPANVVTTPPGFVTSRTPPSATTIFPFESTATPFRVPNFAFEPVPSTIEPSHVVPASVVTTPAGVINRIRALFVSATTMTPVEGITATARGTQKLAFEPVPSAN